MFKSDLGTFWQLCAMSASRDQDTTFLLWEIGVFRTFQMFQGWFKRSIQIALFWKQTLHEKWKKNLYMIFSSIFPNSYLSYWFHEKDSFMFELQETVEDVINPIQIALFWKQTSDEIYKKITWLSIDISRFMFIQTISGKG